MLSDGFWCYGTSPTDANSFCTVFGCTVDTDCAGGCWCATVNDAPNIKTTNAFLRATRHGLPAAHVLRARASSTTIAPRRPTGRSSTASRTPRATATARPQCATDANCPLDATCKNWQSLCTPSQGASCKSDDDCPLLAGVVQHCDGGALHTRMRRRRRLHRGRPQQREQREWRAGRAARRRAPSHPAIAGKCQWRGLCTPRAGVCVGSGGFCSPCHSDADCTNGYCISGTPYSTERFCSVKSTHVPCDTMDANPAGCPVHTTTDNWTLNACVTTPANQCEGFVVLGTSTGTPQPLPGCWTANR